VAEGKLPALGRLTAPMIVVPDVLAALEKAGIAARARTSAKVIAVTGSVGKTSTKEALRHALSAVGSVHASPASFNNHWGVPLTLARMPQDCDYAVFEIGMNHEGEIRPLVKMVLQHVAIVTGVAAAHLGHFSSLDAIARAKAEIFEGVEPGGTALINQDDQRFKLLHKLARDAGVEKIWGYGEHAKAQVRLTNFVLHPDHSIMTAKVGDQEVAAKIGAPGRHVVQNALAVLGAARLVGADVAGAALALAELKAERGRGRRHALRKTGGPFSLIDESYNANPASMKAAIDLLDATPVASGGRRIAVLGDMLELGQYSARLHAGLAELLMATKTDRVFLAGPEMKALAELLPSDFHVEHHETAAELQPILFAAIRPGDTVMVKASKGIGFARLVDAMIKEFSADAEHEKSR
jgi:UDP-N-acetylmuramoyl-tripeptide--D-alanyl-D-alanine ligase